jgi:hypothetical protein
MPVYVAALCGLPVLVDTADTATGTPPAAAVDFSWRVLSRWPVLMTALRLKPLQRQTRR